MFEKLNSCSYRRTIVIQSLAYSESGFETLEYSIMSIAALEVYVATVSTCLQAQRFENNRRIGSFRQKLYSNGFSNFFTLRLPSSSAKVDHSWRNDDPKGLLFCLWLLIQMKVCTQAHCRAKLRKMSFLYFQSELFRYRLSTFYDLSILSRGQSMTFVA